MTSDRRQGVRSLADVPRPVTWSPPFDEAICWRGGSEAQWKRHIRRGERPCSACEAAALRAKADRETRW